MTFWSDGIAKSIGPCHNLSDMSVGPTKFGIVWTEGSFQTYCIAGVSGNMQFKNMHILYLTRVTKCNTVHSRP